MQPLLTEEQAAELLGLKPATLRFDRCRRNLGIPFVKISGQLGRRGGRIGYEPEALAEWLAKRPRSNG